MSRVFTGPHFVYRPPRPAAEQTPQSLPDARSTLLARCFTRSGTWQECVEVQGIPSARRSRQRWRSRQPSLPARPPPLQSAAAPLARSLCPRPRRRPAQAPGQLRLSSEAGGAVPTSAPAGVCSHTAGPQLALAVKARVRALSGFGFSAGLPSTGSSSTPSSMFRLATVRFILGSAVPLSCALPASAPELLACSASAFSALAQGRHALRPLWQGRAAVKWQRLHEAGPGECSASGRLCSAAPCSRELCMLLQPNLAAC